MSMGGVIYAVISNVELQQNQLNGLYMVPVDNSGRQNCMNSITNVITLGNNYKKVGENDEPGSALTENTCGFVVSGLYNYVQGFDVPSKFMSGWMACEKYSLLMSQPDDIGNTVDIKTAAGNGIVPGVGQIINQNGTNVGTQYRLDSEDLKKNCIKNTVFTTKEFYFEIPDTTLSLNSFLVKLHFVKLTNDEIDEVSFEIDELSAAFLDETPTVIN